MINLLKHHFLLDRWWLEPMSSSWAKRYISFGSSYRLFKAFDDTPLTCITSAFWNTANTSLPLLSSDVTSYSQFIDRFISRKRTFEVFWVRNFLLFSWLFSRSIFMQMSLFVLRNKLKRAFCRANLTFKSQILVALFMRFRKVWLVRSTEHLKRKDALTRSTLASQPVPQYISHIKKKKTIIPSYYLALQWHLFSCVDFSPTWNLRAFVSGLLLLLCALCCRD